MAFPALQVLLTSREIVESALQDLAGADAREYWGRPRPYMVVFRLGVGGGSKQPIAVFVAADNYETTHDYLAVIPRSWGSAGPADVLLSGDTARALLGPGLDIAVFRDRIAGTDRFRGYNRLAVVANEIDSQSMMRHAALQVALRHP